MNLTQAQTFLFELQQERPICINCLKYLPTSGVTPGAFPEWDRDVLADIVIQRCQACLKPSHPWAKSLTAEQVLEWLQANPPVPGERIDVEKMRRDLTGGGFRFL